MNGVRCKQGVLNYFDTDVLLLKTRHFWQGKINATVCDNLFALLKILRHF